MAVATLEDRFARSASATTSMVVRDVDAIAGGCIGGTNRDESTVSVDRSKPTSGRQQAMSTSRVQISDPCPPVAALLRFFLIRFFFALVAAPSVESAAAAKAVLDSAMVRVRLGLIAT